MLIRHSLFPRADQLLLKVASHNIDASPTDRNGVTPLHIACLRRNLRIVQALIDSGADPAVQDKKGANEH